MSTDADQLDILREARHQARWNKPDGLPNLRSTMRRIREAPGWGAALAAVELWQCGLVSEVWA